MSMTNFKKRFEQFFADEAGQSTTEYILILAVVVMIAMKFKGSMNKTMDKQMQNLDNTLNRAFDAN
ncbi:MAG: hypothetical protein KGQ59_12810 [Bdellovibrionales bacterium]|nr:hypothetical protein [Bdellovibrionales bacterium]